MATRFPLLGSAFLLALSCIFPAVAAPRLERVVLLERHGVRSPTRAPSDLAPYAQTPWAEWSVAPGYLTDHGAQAIARMGSALRSRYAASLPDRGCRGKEKLFVWADNADQRTKVSGQAVADAMAPGCGIKAQWLEGADDAIFHAAGETCPLDQGKAQAALAAQLEATVAAHRESYDKARIALQSILSPGLGPDGCRGQASQQCILLSDQNRAANGKLSGTLAQGSTLSENLFLEYAEGMRHPGWGRLDRSRLADIMPLHALASDLTRRTPELAAPNGTLLARQIESLLTDVPAFRHQVPVPDQARVVLLLGHDTNLSNLAGMLRLGWQLPGEPDATAPDTVLAFERWRSGRRSLLKIKVYYQTPDELRELTVFDTGHPVHVTNLQLTGCIGGACTIENLKAALDKTLVKECLSP
jgi:4-phytase/acid phosphatase